MILLKKMQPILYSVLIPVEDIEQAVQIFTGIELDFNTPAFFAGTDTDFRTK